IGLLLAAILLPFAGCSRSTQTAVTLTDADSQTVTTSGSDATVAQSTTQFVSLADGLKSAPLPKRELSAGTLFRLLSVEQTGIDFAHNWTPPEGYKLEIYNSLPGGGVCIGDYDGDNLPDVFLTQANVGSQFYRNLGQMKFENVTAATGIVADDKGRGAAFADVDNDGDLDLYVCNDERPNQLFINDGKGKFRENAAAAGLDFNGASVMAAFADYDRDGDLDMYLVTNRKEPQHEVPAPKRRPDGTFDISEENREFVDVIVSKGARPRVIKAAQYDHLYRNNGDGTFTDVSQEAGLVGNYWGLSATWWDYNRDGWIDIYVANDFYSPDQLYRNNGDGTFTDAAKVAFAHT
ncbi:MAG: FG-GAP repeat domain-containing protein, partial [Pseudomonadales bacterium]